MALDHTSTLDDGAPELVKEIVSLLRSKGYIVAETDQDIGTQRSIDKGVKDFSPALGRAARDLN